MLAAATAIHNDAKRFVLRVGRDGSARIRTVELLRPVDKERCVHTVFLDKGFHRRTGPLVIKCSPHVCVVRSSMVASYVCFRVSGLEVPIIF